MAEETVILLTQTAILSKIQGGGQNITFSLDFRQFFKGLYIKCPIGILSNQQGNFIVYLHDFK